METPFDRMLRKQREDEERLRRTTEPAGSLAASMPWMTPESHTLELAKNTSIEELVTGESTLQDMITTALGPSTIFDDLRAAGLAGNLRDIDPLTGDSTRLREMMTATLAPSSMFDSLGVVRAAPVLGDIDPFTGESIRIREMMTTALGPSRTFARTVFPTAYGDIAHIDGSTSSSISSHHAASQGSAGDSSRLQKKLHEVEEVGRLRLEVEEKTRAIDEQKAESQEQAIANREIEDKLVELTEKQRLAHLLTRVESAAQEQLLESQEFRSLFSGEESCEAFVISIDIRRSTELMLKARSPKLYAEFIFTLTHKLRDLVLENHGIFDKFTGDGVLAFFPLFYTGPDAGILALRTAHEAHKAFSQHYTDHRRCFASVLLDVGLGVGIDFGTVQTIQLGSEFTVVGQPVVYACRLATAPAGKTFVNQPAFEPLRARHATQCDLLPVEVDVKHEGRTLAYAAELKAPLDYPITAPAWLRDTSSPPNDAPDGLVTEDNGDTPPADSQA